MIPPKFRIGTVQRRVSRRLGLLNSEHPTPLAMDYVMLVNRSLNMNCYKKFGVGDGIHTRCDEPFSIDYVGTSSLIL